jgi:PPOX class probable F420-dependent enzyme
MTVDFNTDIGRRAEKRLREEQVIWLTAVRADGTPQPNPVWFLWDGGTVLIFTQPESRKVRHIQGNPHVALHFNTDAHGGDVVVIGGLAAVENGAPPEAQIEAYIDKYRAGIASLGMTPEAMRGAFSTAIRVTPTRLRGL